MEFFEQKLTATDFCRNLKGNKYSVYNRNAVFLQRIASECVEKKCVLKNTRLSARNFALLQLLRMELQMKKRNL